MCERQKAFKTVVFGGGCEQIWESTVCNPEAEERESVLVLKLALLPQTFSSFFFSTQLSQMNSFSLRPISKAAKIMQTGKMLSPIGASDLMF